MNRRSLLQYAGLSALASALPEHPALPQSMAPPPPAPFARFNQVGFLPGALKIATLTATPGQDQAFTLVAEPSGKTVFTGRLSAPTLDPDSGDTVALATFSAFKTPGIYRLAAQGQRKRSEPFAIKPDVFADPLRLSVRAFYGQRCGCAVDLGDGYSHPVCHPAGAFHPTSGRAGQLPNSGGWHDAGDYGRYIVNSGISTATLLWAWELYPQALQPLSLAIPESGGKLPDYLAEVRWNLEWMLSLQDQDGGVWHKQTSERFCAFIMPQADTLTSYVIGTGAAPFKNTTATADLAAVMAIAARCYRPYDPAFSSRCLVAAKLAWSWAVSHPDIPFHNPKGIATGDYGDQHCADELLWASAELWRTTGEAHYEQAFISAIPPDFNIQAPSWGGVAPLAFWTYALAERKHSQPVSQSIVQETVQQTIKAASILLARHSVGGYGHTLAPSDYIWGSNAVAANQSLLLLVADRLHPDRQCTDAAFGNLDYLLGRNCFGISWVTHVGTNPFLHPHHRPSASDNITAPWPGMLSGGPNARPGDNVARTLGALPPMRMWIDNQDAYSLNEIAINWNAPLVFLLAAAHAQRSA